MAKQHLPIVTTTVSSTSPPGPESSRRASFSSVTAGSALFARLALALDAATDSHGRTPAATASPTAARVPLTEVTTAVGRVRRAAHRLAIRTGHVRRLIALLADDDAEFDHLAVAHRAHHLLGVVLYYC